MYAMILIVGLYILQPMNIRKKLDIVNIQFIRAIHEIFNYVGFVLIGCKFILYLY